MATITADLAVERWLEKLQEVTEIRDANGKCLGTFTPAMSADEIALYEKAKQLFDPEETERIIARERGMGRPLAEIWKELEALETKS
jgi:hypothetical protein